MNAFFAVFGLSGTELIVILVVVLVLFGAKRIPELAKGLGKGINEFKKASREVTDAMETEQQEQSATPPKTPPANTTAQAAAQPATPPTETKAV